MNDLMPCWTDSEELNRFPAEEVEEESPLSLMEARIQWVCDSWHDAMINNTYDEWANVRSELYGARQALIWADYRMDDLKALMLLGDIAHMHSRDCIKAGRYEGAPA